MNIHKNYHISYIIIIDRRVVVVPPSSILLIRFHLLAPFLLLINIINLTDVATGEKTPSLPYPARTFDGPLRCVQTPGEATEKKTVPRSYHYPLLRASVSTRNSRSSHPPERSPSLTVGLTPAGVDAIGLNPISRSYHRADIDRRPWCFSSTFNCTIPPRCDNGNQRNHPSLRWTPAD